MKKEEIASALRMASNINYNGARYRLLGFFMYYDKVSKTLKYSAEIADSNGRTVVRAPLEKVEIANGVIELN